MDLETKLWRKWQKRKRQLERDDERDRLGNPKRMLLTKEEYIKIWIDSGHAHEMGKQKGQYCMSRVDDLGSYQTGNVFIQLHSGNTSDARKIYPDPIRTKESFEKGAKKFKENYVKESHPNFGKPLKQSTKDAIGAANKGKILGTPSNAAKLKNSASVSNLIWITNGVERKRIKKTESIPIGFWRGRVAPRVKSTANVVGISVWANDGTTNKKLPKDQPLPDGYILGKIQINSLDEMKDDLKTFVSNSIWINNGIINKRVQKDQEIPVDFKLGRK